MLQLAACAPATAADPSAASGCVAAPASPPSEVLGAEVSPKDPRHAAPPDVTFAAPATSNCDDMNMSVVPATGVLSPQWPRTASQPKKAGIATKSNRAVNRAMANGATQPVCQRLAGCLHPGSSDAWAFMTTEREAQFTPKRVSDRGLRLDVNTAKPNAQSILLAYGAWTAGAQEPDIALAATAMTTNIASRIETPNHALNTRLARFSCAAGTSRIRR